MVSRVVVIIIVSRAEIKVSRLRLTIIAQNCGE
jgi:hypothetical protein